MRACFELEMKALKPGNVSHYAAGHGMNAADFLLSARLVSPILCDASLSVGERVFQAVRLTQSQVGCNTNLGLLLLCAPLLAAAALRGRLRCLRLRLCAVLRALSARDGERIFAAIRLAHPGGLGSSRRYDVRCESGTELLAAMHYARCRDRIALQYVSVFDDIFSLGVPWVAHFRAGEESMEWVLALCYISFLCAFPDSHVVRKHGKTAAERVCREARMVRQRLVGADAVSDRVADLLRFDSQLKQDGFNPGTSADLAVASLLACRLGDALMQPS